MLIITVGSHAFLNIDFHLYSEGRLWNTSKRFFFFKNFAFLWELPSTYWGESGWICFSRGTHAYLKKWMCIQADGIVVHCLLVVVYSKYHERETFTVNSWKGKSVSQWRMVERDHLCSSYRYDILSTTYIRIYTCYQCGV